MAKQGPNLSGGGVLVSAGQTSITSIKNVSVGNYHQVISGAKEESKNIVVAIFYDDEEIMIKTSRSLVVARTKMIMWCLNNCVGSFHQSFEEYYFQFKDDAIAFKLRFDGE